MGHLDKKAGDSCLLKQGILDTLSQCVSVAADGSLGIITSVCTDAVYIMHRPLNDMHDVQSSHTYGY